MRILLLLPMIANAAVDAPAPPLQIRCAEAPPTEGSWLGLARTTDGYRLDPAPSAGPIVWIRGLPGAEGPVRSAWTVPTGPSATAHEVSSTRAVWTLRRDEQGLEVSRLDLRSSAVAAQRLPVPSDAVLSWAGDLDGDGELDLLVGRTLYLSSRAEAGALVSLAATDHLEVSALPIGP